MARSGSVADMQKRAAGFYGFPGTENRAVGEVRYVVGWHADQMTRLDWDVFIGGSDNWTVEVPAVGDGEPGRISTDVDGEQDQTAASAELLELIDWNDTNIRDVDTNLFVTGQGDYCQFDTGWRVVSMMEVARKKTVESADQSVPFLWSHPFDPKKPDAPLFSVLELLDELDWLTRQGRTQSRQRVLTSGMLFSADGFHGPPGPNGEATTFWDQWNAAISAKMIDPDDMSPIRFEGPSDLVKDGVNWVWPEYGYDSVLGRKVESCIHRLAYGLPIPPEILLGMQAQSRATAFQVEENAYRAHIEPPALMVAQVAQDALKLILDNDDVEVVPNPSRLLARKNSVEDVKWAKSEGLATDGYAREVLGIPEDAAPVSEADMDPAVKTALDMAVAAPSLAQVPGLPDLVNQIRSIVDGTPYVPSTPAAAPIATDPANDAAGEGSPIAAAAKTPDLSDLLADIDAHLSSELAGYTVSVTERARQRLGAAARTNPTVRSDTALKSLASAQLASHLGMDGLANAGVDVATQIAEPIDAASRWWMRRIEQVWEQMGTLVPGWAGQGAWVDESIDKLADALTVHVVETLSEPDAPPLDAGAIRTILDAAAGG